ncbi:MAG TPA: acyl-CoA thioesterase [Polyangia bacterium]|nr:acyl-CoA thioesterase [Polyangia bacterium]
MTWIPDSIPAAQRARLPIHLRYEDVCQDGRLPLLGIPPAATALWGTLISHHSLAQELPRLGVLPILSRIVIEGHGGPIAVLPPVDVDCAFQLAHGVDARGEVNRLYLNSWIAITGTLGRTHGPQPADAGRPVLVGQFFSESVFTRPFAPPAERKVLRFGCPGLPDLPPDRHESPAPERLLDLPAGAVALEPALAEDAAPLAFGLMHTDSNQHVNSLVYPRLFEEAALRRFAALGLGHRVLGRRVEVAYRKPAFAGDVLRIRLRTGREDTGTDGDARLHAVGLFVSEGSADAKPHGYLRMTFAP